MRRAHRTHGLAISALAEVPAAGAVSAGSKPAAGTLMPPFGERQNPALRGEHMDVTVETDAQGQPRLLRRLCSTGAFDFPAARTTP